MIEIRRVSKYYLQGDHEPFYALNNINLTINEGEFVAIVGKSGSGKSTLLNIIGSLETVSEGNVFVNNTDISKFVRKERDWYRNREIGIVFQAFYLEPTYTVFQNIELPLLALKLSKKEREERINETLSSVGLLDKSRVLTRNLSGGERQRTCIARALVNHPQILLADEPCGNLDTRNSKIIMDILSSLHEQKKTIILVTHNMEDAVQTAYCQLNLVVILQLGKAYRQTTRRGECWFRCPIIQKFIKHT